MKGYYDKIHNYPAIIVDARTEMLRWANESAVGLLEIPKNVNISKSSIHRFLPADSDWNETAQQIKESRVQAHFFFIIKTHTGKLYTVEAVGNYSKIIYPIYSIAFEPYAAVGAV